MARILIVDDDEQLRSDLSEALGERGYEVEQASSAEEALRKVVSQNFDAALLDMMMPGINGMDALVQLKKLSPRMAIIMITAFATIESAVEAMKRGASDYIAKPFKLGEVDVAVRRALEEVRFRSTFDKSGGSEEIGKVIDAVANPLRRQILKFLHEKGVANFMSIVEAMKMDDHTKLAFHLRNLRSSRLVEQDTSRKYMLSQNGEKVVMALRDMADLLLKG